VDLIFRRGDASRPRGHALAYFETPDGRTYATYLVIPPVSIDLGKYMPPMFAAQMAVPTQAEVSAMPLPPIPEEVAGGLAEVDRLAELREDDVIGCGTFDPKALDRALMAAAEAGQAYVALYRTYLAGAPAQVQAREEHTYSIDEVLLSFESDHDRIERLAKLIGQLRYALDGGDKAGADEAVAEMERVGRHLAAKYRFEEIVAAARRSGEEAARLAQLHVERCYKLSREDYAEVARIEGEIKRLSGQG
jgi:hypothetical protein